MIEHGDFLIRNPRTIGVDRLPAERIPIGLVSDYKPCLARLVNGDLAIVAFRHFKREGGKVFEPLIWFRSTDGGRIWSEGTQLDLLGAEAYLSVLKDPGIAKFSLPTQHSLTRPWRNHRPTHPEQG